MRWLVSFDLTLHSVGVLRLARWLHARSGGQHLFHGIHVDTRPNLGLHGDGGELGSGPDLEPTLQQARAFLERHELLDALGAVEVRLGAPVAVLPALVRERSFDGLMLGRAAPIGRLPLVALGSVPRRLLRQPELPTMIVPPDLDESSLGQGPLLVGVDPSPHCLEAVAFARRLARVLSLRVLLVHAIPRETPVAVMGALSVEPRDPTMATIDIVPPVDTTPAEHSIARWVADHGLQDLALEIRRGPVPSSLRNAAREHAATMIVGGSRRLTLAERVLTSSISSDLAARADRPVLVVPPPVAVP